MTGSNAETFLTLSGMQRTALSSLATIIYALFTYWIIHETKKSTKQSKKFFELSQQPNIDIYIERDESWQSLLNIIIKNTGYDGAYNIKLDTDTDIKIFKGNDEYTLKNSGYFKNGISYLPPSGSRESNFTVMSEDYENKIKLKITVSVSYKDKVGNHYKGEFLINLNQFENTTHSQEPPLYKISKNIESIQKDFHSIVTGFKKLQIITQTLEDKKLEDADDLNDVKKMKELIKKTRIDGGFEDIPGAISELSN